MVIGGVCCVGLLRGDSLVGWVQEGAKTDPILNAELMKENPWVDKGKCVIL